MIFRRPSVDSCLRWKAVNVKELLMELFWTNRKDKEKKTNDHSNFTARTVSLSSVSMQICSTVSLLDVASFSEGEANFNIK